MKKILKYLLAVFLLIIISCGKNENRLVIGVSPVPHKELVELVKEDLKEKNIYLEIV